MIRNKILSKRSAIHLLLVGMIVLGTIADTTKVLAMKDQEFYAGNEITHHDPEALLGSLCGAGAGGVQLAGKDNIEKALSFYMGKGLNLMQAAGIVGNYMAESGVDPRKEEGGAIKDDSYSPINGTGFGIAQWTWTSRQAPLVQFMKDNGNLGITDLGGQLGFSWQEMQGSHKHAYESLKAATSPLNAAYVFHRDFEGSNDSEEAIRANRGGNAEKLYAQYKDAPPLAGTPSTSGDTSSFSGACSAPTGNLAQTILAYAWEDFKGVGYVTKKPDYETAVQRAKSTPGRYTGDTCFGGGVDCGAFVTLLMVDSGYEPQYNSSGKGGNTISQRTWAEKNWVTVGKGNTMRVGGDLSDPKVLRQGDVAISDGHTFMYAGDIPGFNSKIASASQCDRAPMAGKENPIDGEFTWYRKKGVQ